MVKTLLNHKDWHSTAWIMKNRWPQKYRDKVEQEVSGPNGEPISMSWARSTSGDITEGISWIVDGIEDFRAIGALRAVPFFLALKAEALHLADRTFEALEAIREAEGLVERFEERLWRADLHRLRGVLLTAMGADETQIEASFCEAVRTARQQKSISLARRAEASYAEYRSKKGKL